MVIIKLMGGIGNQLFQYALYKQFSYMGKDVLLDRSKSDVCNLSTDVTMIDKYQVCPKYCSIKERNKLTDEGTSLLKRIRRKVLGVKTTQIYEKNYFVFDEHIMQIQDGYLDGYWQSYKYFDEVRNRLIEEITPVERLNEDNQKILNQILSYNSVAVHVRRGDYLELDEIYGGICTENYYHSAVSYMEKKLKNPHFFVFSNDLQWCKSFFGTDKSFFYVDVNDWNHGYLDLYLMKNCQHNIIANSSFSWWGAYLNDHSDRIIISPKRWINNCISEDIIPSEWIRIDEEGRLYDNY